MWCSDDIEQSMGWHLMTTQNFATRRTIDFGEDKGYAVMKHKLQVDVDEDLMKFQWAISG